MIVFSYIEPPNFQHVCIYYFLQKRAEYIQLYILLLTRYIYLYILTDMKKILISVDDDIVEILERADNKSAYIRKAILAEQDNNLTQEVRRLSMLVDGFVDDLRDIKVHIDFIKQNMSSNGARSALGVIDDTVLEMKNVAVTKGSEFVPRPPDPETGYPCCNGRSPCKHWVWSGIDGAWKNTLTGKTRDA